jgi:hypothetical protein
MTPADLMRALGMEPNAWQAGILESPVLYRFRHVGGRGAGATTLALALTLHHALTRERASALLVTPAAGAMLAVLDSWKDRLAMDWWAATRGRLLFPNGSRILVREPDRLYLWSLTAELIVIDQANEVPVVARLAILSSRTRHREFISLATEGDA